MKKSILILALFIVSMCVSCGQQNPLQSDPMVEEVEAVDTRVSVYQSLNSGSLSDHLSLTLIQRNTLQTVTNQDIANRNTLVEATRQGLITYNTFTQHKRALDQTFSNTFLNLLTTHQLNRYDVLSREVLNTHYIAKTDHTYWNFVKLVELIDE